MSVRLVAAAQVELDDAVAYYDSRRAGLGSEFALAVLSGLQQIERHPTAWQGLEEPFRQYRLKRFPFGLIYVVRQPSTVIVAVMHLHRMPGYWIDRDLS